MKKTFLILFAILPIMVFSQIDSTVIYFNNWVEDNDTRTICDLSNIQIIKILSKDTILRGKVFNFKIKEIKKGKIVSEDNLNISNKVEKIPMVINGDTMIYVIDMFDKAGYGKSTDTLLITFAGLLDKKGFKLKIDFPGMGFNKKLKGKDDYLLRVANSKYNNKIKVPINSEYPVLVYTPPINTGAELNSYCLLETENILDWYDKFKIKHYYVIYIEIK